jgi:predicted AlkP superfamily phosphohydrolase/phosphomutase
MSRRDFVKLAGGAAVALLGGGLEALAAGPHASTGHRRVLVLGIDGMSPDILVRLVAEGRMPHFARLIKEGDFRKLQSSIPPQSPVAWSNFITGMNPGAHGIYDFLHRDPATLSPYLSTSQTFPAGASLALGSYRIPLRGGGVKLLRQGPAFWKLLSEHGVPCTLFKLPANFPPVECSARTLSGLGTPDMLGAYGVSSCVTDTEPPNRDRLTDTHLTVVDMSRHACEAFLVGPENTFRNKPVPLEVPFTVHRDPTNPVARITIQDTEILLKQGEWSDWVRVRFKMLPALASVTGICRFFMKEVHPGFKLYVSPVNIDPSNPAMPISTPGDFSRQLVRELGLFYTQGIPHDTKALSSGILSEDEYLEQSAIVYEERMKAYDYFLKHFRSGLLFFYISSVDLNSHMYWRAMDPRHPLYTLELGRRYGKVIDDLYVAMDHVLAKTFEHIDDGTTLIVLSDHGFSPFYRMFGLNGWLVENGYASLRDPGRRGSDKLFDNTDWNRTFAYGLGINALYLNVRGRERFGCVSRGRQEKMLRDEIAEKLEQVRDPETGERVIKRAYRKEEVYHGGCVEDAPDIVLGFSRGYRASWGTILGTCEKDIIADNDDKWSGDHCMDVTELPGVLLSNRKITSESPALIDLAPTILGEYGVEPPPGTEGKPILEKT